MPSYADEDFAPFASARQNSIRESAEDAIGDLELDAVVVGASWAGIWALYRMAQLGLRVKMIEACDDVGGVWFYTRYPGCKVDTEIPLYEFSKEELWNEWYWKERFPARADIHAYLRWVCDRLDIRKHIIFNTQVGGCHWQQDTQKWNVLNKKGGLIAKTRFFLPCSGYSTIRYIPDYPGKETFKDAYHTSAWPEKLDCTGKRVAVIGTAASGIQVIEALAPIVSHLTVFQRTPNLSTPMRQRKFTREEMREYKEQYPRKFKARISHNGFDVSPPEVTTFDVTAEQREAFWERCWVKGGLNFWFANYPDMMTDQKANDLAYDFWRRKTIARIDDPVKAAILAPKKPPHPFGAKRPSLETEYFERYNQPNVDLVDVNEDPILEITPAGIRTESGLHEVDIIAYATGFDFITGSMLAMGIKGVNGESLNAKWDVTEAGTGVWTNLGLMTAGYPNMFFPMGPQAPSALGLTPQMAEIQGNWIANVIEMMFEKGFTTIAPTVEAEKAWKKEVNRASDCSLLRIPNNSWYMGVNIPSRRKEALCYFGGVDLYIEKITQVAENNYEGFTFGSASSNGATNNGYRMARAQMLEVTA